MGLFTRPKEKPGFLICTAYHGLKRLAESTQLGQKARPKQNPLPIYKDIPIVYCSYYCEGYQASFYEAGIIFETSDPILYATPCDSFVFMRQLVYLPGYEDFIFRSKYEKQILQSNTKNYPKLMNKINKEHPDEAKKPLWEMLAKYPTSISFRKEFREFFHNLSPKEKYPAGDPYVRDEVDYKEWLKSKDYINEIGFKAPLNIRVVDTFKSREELKKKFEKLL